MADKNKNPIYGMNCLFLGFDILQAHALDFAAADDFRNDGIPDEMEFFIGKRPVPGLFYRHVIDHGGE